MFLIFWLIKGTRKYKYSQNVAELKEFHSNLHNFGFRNSSCLFKNCNFVLIFQRDFIAVDSPFRLASRQQLRYSTIQFCFILLLLYVMLSSGKFLSLLEECILFYLHQNELITYYQQTYRIHLQILYSKHFRIP